MTLPDRPYEAIRVAHSDGVATITLNRPERRNAIGPTMTNELLWALEDATNDAEVRSIVITGAGKTFCAGGDFAEMSQGSSGPKVPPRGDFKDLLLALWNATKPVVSRVNGHAMGGGLGIAAASTFAVAASEARFGTPEVDVGLFPFMIYAVLEQRMSRRDLHECALLGRKFDAESALRMGLVNRVVAAEALDGAVREYTDAVASKSPVTLRIGLEAIRDSEGLPMAGKLPILQDRLTRCLATDDAREGLSAFLEKRPPKWTGK